MFGTVGRFKVKPGKRDELIKTMQVQTEGNPPDGAVVVFVFNAEADPDEIYLVAIAEDRAKYFDNAERPETQANYEIMSQYFVEEPQWHDGEVVYQQFRN